MFSNDCVTYFEEAIFSNKIHEHELDVDYTQSIAKSRRIFDRLYLSQSLQVPPSKNINIIKNSKYRLT
jgi:hypothetical protein